MNNLSHDKYQKDRSQFVEAPSSRSSWRSWLYNLPINRKTELIPWFSFGGLLLVVGAGGLILQGNLKNQLLQQGASRLETKSEIVKLVLSANGVADNQMLQQTMIASTEKQGYSAIYVPQAGEKFVLAASAMNLNGKATSNVALTENQILQQAVKRNPEIVNQIEAIDGNKYALVAKTLADQNGQTIGILVHGSSLKSFNSILKSSLLAQSILSLVILILIIYLSKILATAIAQPIKNLQQVAQNFSEGDLSARAKIKTKDEVGLLSDTFNVLADSIEMNEARLKQDAERSRLFGEIAYDISQAADVEQVLQTAAASSKTVLNAERVIYLQFDENWQGKIIAEAVDRQFPQALGAEINDPCFAEGYAEKYQQGEIKAIANIFQAGLNDCHLKMLEPFAVVASLVTPVIGANRLAGLLIAHQCSEARAWQQDEISLLKQVAEQVGQTLEKIELLEQQRQSQQKERAAKENLQRRALELLMEVDPVTQGDLTVQVKVQEDEIGTIGDSYNATIESLRKLVSQVKTAAVQVSTTTSDKDLSLKELSTGATAQTKEINAALERIQGITDSIQAVANNAKAAELAMLKSAATVKAGDEAMNQTVSGFQEIRDTVAATAKKVKRLGESSQKISKVVNVISNFADQTNLLALNASIEAAHAGEEGRGFAVVADEVRSLARQSADATAEIEALVAEIQSETNEVVAAMEAGTEQVVAGTKLVDKTRLSLIQIADVSQEINQLVGEIAAATVAQSQDSEVVSQTMVEVAAISSKTATEAGEVSASFQDLLTVAQQLQQSVAKFKVS